MREDRPTASSCPWAGARALAAAIAICAGLTWAPQARAFGELDKLTVGQIQYEGRWNPRPSGPRRLAWEVDKRTSIETAREPHPVSLSDEAELRRYPFLLLAGDAALPTFSEAEVARLRRHLVAGGFLLIDASEPSPAFDRAARALIARLFPAEKLKRLPADHVVYKSFYLLRTPVGRIAAVPYLEGVERDGRLPIVYSQNDLLGAWAKDAMGEWELEVQPGGEAQREMAIRLGINLAMYVLCLDYKSDQVHVPFILRRRKWQ